MFTIIPAYTCEISYRTDTFTNLVKVSQLTMKSGNKQLLGYPFVIMKELNIQALYRCILHLNIFDCR